jgi:hypothetical protein
MGSRLLVEFGFIPRALKTLTDAFCRSFLCRNSF